MPQFIPFKKPLFIKIVFLEQTLPKKAIEISKQKLLLDSALPYFCPASKKRVLGLLCQY